MPGFTSWISWGPGRPCQAVGKPKMPHHNVTLQPQWQTTNPRDTQVNDLSHLVRGEHCLPNNQGMTWVIYWGQFRLKHQGWRLMGYILQMGPNITSRAKFDDLRAVPSSVKRVWQGNACVGVRREVEAILTYISHQWYTTLVLEPENTRMCRATVEEVKVKDVNVIRSSSTPSHNVDNFLKGLTLQWRVSPMESLHWSLHSEVSE